MATLKLSCHACRDGGIPAPHFTGDDWVLSFACGRHMMCLWHVAEHILRARYWGSKSLTCPRCYGQLHQGVHLALLDVPRERAGRGRSASSALLALLRAWWTCKGTNPLITWSPSPFCSYHDTEILWLFLTNLQHLITRDEDDTRLCLEKVRGLLEQVEQHAEKLRILDADVLLLQTMDGEKGERPVRSVLERCLQRQREYVVSERPFQDGLTITSPPWLTSAIHAEKSGTPAASR